MFFVCVNYSHATAVDTITGEKLRKQVVRFLVHTPGEDSWKPHVYCTVQ